MRTAISLRGPASPTRNLSLAGLLLGAACSALLAVPRSAPAGEPFGLDQVAAKAAALAREPYRDRRGVVPPWMLFTGSMTYDQWRDIRFRPDKSLWRAEGLPFQIQLFHPGLYYDHTVAMNIVDADADGAHPLPFSVGLFDYGKNTFVERIPKDLGFAGFRVHAPFKTPSYFDEVVVFLGATYLRAVGRDNAYGLSARAITIDTVEPTGEEFPDFVEFWLVEPAANAASLVIHALMDGPSVSGAYRFEVTPGEATRIDVEARLFPRKPIRKLGIAPLTSMFFFGENTVHAFEDFRPEVHDSDGLLLHFDTGEWLWRPLENPPRIEASSFGMRNPRGFGLIQRDRDFASHQDLETHSELRPSAWVTPRGDWGEGRVELVQIPTATELVDNVVASWIPREQAIPGGELTFAYSVKFYGDDPTLPPGGRVVATRRDRGPKKTSYRFVIDFAGGALGSIPADEPPTAVVSAGPRDATGDPFDEHLVPNPSIHGWRLTFQVVPKGDKPVELRAFLKRKGDVLSETWSYSLLPSARPGG